MYLSRLHRSGIRLDPEYGGTGLGMRIAKSLAEKMGGTLSFVSRQGVGTTFTLSLPFRICHAPEKRNKPKRLLQTSSIAGTACAGCGR